MERCFICSGERTSTRHRGRCHTCHCRVLICAPCGASQWPPFGFRHTNNCCHQCVSKRRDAWLACVNSFVASEWCAVLPPDLVKWYLLPAIYRSNPPPLSSFFWHAGKISIPCVPYCFGCAVRVNDERAYQDCVACKLVFELCYNCRNVVGLCFFCKYSAEVV
jgi:hypothetical protein